MWNELVTTALIGTERRSFTLDGVPEALRDLAAQVEGQEAERKLLMLAGTMALYRRAGQTPQIDTAPLPEPSKSDTLPPCSPRAGLTLQQILALSNHSQHLQEWITAAYSAHQRIADEYLPRFLMAFEKKSTLPDHFYDVLGERGRWLAQQNPAWAYAVVPQTDAEWELADINARDHYLRQLHLSDPAHARALIESVWKSENAETRAVLIKTFKPGLSLDDEAFLEAALDDRADNVRMMAAWLLAQLSGSAYQRRMIARAQPLIQIERKRKKLNIAVNLPETYDESMTRDGVPAKPPLSTKQSTSQYWLWSAVASRLPAAFWLRGNWSAHELVQALQGSAQWGEALLDAVALIAVREQNGALTEALLSASLDSETERLVLAAARPADREACILRKLNEAHRLENESVLALLRKIASLDCQWSQQLAHSAINLMRETAPRQSAVEINSLAVNLPIFAARFSPTCLTAWQSLVDVETKNQYLWTYNINHAAETLEFRQKMLKEFSR